MCVCEHACARNHTGMCECLSIIITAVTTLSAESEGSIYSDRIKVRKLSCNNSIIIIMIICFWVAQRSINMRVYLRDRSAQTNLHAATLR